MNYSRQSNIGPFAILIAFICFITLIILILFGWPHYKVWKQGMDGQAALAEAEQSKMIQVQVAKAELESAKLRAEAIKLVGQAAKDYPEYRKQEFIGAFGEALRDGRIQQIIMYRPKLIFQLWKRAKTVTLCNK